MAQIGIGKEAPKLIWIGDKWNGKGTYNEDKRPDGYYFGQVPDIIRNYVMNSLRGDQGNMLKIMWYLIDTAEGFKLAEKTILEATGLQHVKYIQARAILTEIGWLVRDENFPDQIGLNYNFLWTQALLPREKQINMSVRIDQARIKLGYKK